MSAGQRVPAARASPRAGSSRMAAGGPEVPEAPEPEPVDIGQVRTKIDDFLAQFKSEVAASKETEAASEDLAGSPASTAEAPAEDMAWRSEMAAPSKGPKKKFKSKTDRFDLQFVCNVCNATNRHSISRHGYTKGTVIVVCPNEDCKSAHLISDNLNWMKMGFTNIEEFMARQGKPVKRVVSDGPAVEAAKDIPMDPSPPEQTDLNVTDGIEDEDAVRSRLIREAIQANRARKRAQRAADLRPDHPTEPKADGDEEESDGGGDLEHASFQSADAK